MLKLFEMIGPTTMQEFALPLLGKVLGTVWAHTVAGIFYYLRIWEVSKNNEEGVYLFLCFQVFDSIPKPYVQKEICKALFICLINALFRVSFKI